MYDAVVIATGSALGKRLGILGEDIPGSMSVAGLTYGEFAPVLHSQGWALNNLASPSHIFIAD